MKMQRELWAALLLGALIAASLLNARHIDHLTDGIIAQLQQAEEEAEQGQLQKAAQRVESCRRSWEEARRYTYSAMRHEETDAVFDGFYDLLERLSDGEADALGASFDRLVYRLRVIGVREHISVESVL